MTVGGGFKGGFGCVFGVIAAFIVIAVLFGICAAIADRTDAGSENTEAEAPITARQFEDERVEFGPQPRYSPDDAVVDRWRRSGVIEVVGVEIGRIEFAFTPTSRERILPRSRYFLVDGDVAR